MRACDVSDLDKTFLSLRSIPGDENVLKQKFFTRNCKNKFSDVIQKEMAP